MMLLQCDETKPTCNQCAKSRRQCPGYKDEFDLVFRNETQATERRAQKANRKAIAQRLKLEPDSDDDQQESLSPVALEYLRSQAESGIIPALGIATEQHAACHFVSNFILVPRVGDARGFNDHLIPLIRSEPSNSHLMHAFNACALASMANRLTSDSIDLSERALSEYTKALATTHAAIQDTDRSKSDSTLAAVLLLGLFENMTAKQLGVFAWGSHIEGAIQLVKARGRKQLRTKLGLHLFVAVRTQMIIHTLSSAKAPIMGVDWWLADAVKDEAAAQSQRLNLKASELRAEVTRLMSSVARTPENIEVMLDIIRRAQMVDQECVNWARNLAEGWQFKTITWEDNVPGGDYSKAEVYPGRVDVYPDFYIASVWNMTRVCRLVLASVIVRCAAWVCSPVDYRTTPEYATAARTCVDTITDIIASVPYHLGWHLKRKHLLQDQLTGFACGDDDNLKGLPGYFLTWPLTNVNSQDFTTDSQRAWVRGRLNYIATEVGVKYAHILAQVHSLVFFLPDISILTSCAARDPDPIHAHP